MSISNGMMGGLMARAKIGTVLLPILRASAALVAFVAVPVLSAGINDTGITAVQDAYGNPTSCADGSSFPRQDACFGRDPQANSGTLNKTGGGGKGFDFTQIYDSGKWACTQDNVTGLIWEVKTTAGGLHNRNNTYTWYQGGVGVPDGGSCPGGSGCDTTKFVADVNAAGLCGANDWRMPTVKELEGLVDYGVNLNSNPSPAAIDPTYFSDTSIDQAFWTSALDSATAAYPWAIDFQDGSVTHGHPFQGTLHVRLVRGTANPSQFVFTTNGTTVTDNSTGLMWKRDYEMLDPNNPGDYLNRKDTFLWSTALQRAVADRTGGYLDWRVPSVKELHTLTDLTRDHPSMNTSFFPATPQGSYFWSSSPTFDYRWNSMVWNVGFDFGQDGIAVPYQTSYVRLVRGGDAFNVMGNAISLSVTELGTGSGTVVSSPGGINCGTACGMVYASGTGVTLSATADAGSTFTGWGGACSGTGTCTVSMTQAQNVTATFSSSGYTLSVTELGTGTGAVISSPGGINCGTTCSMQFASGTSVALSATADAGSTFTGWGGACSGAGPCNVNMNQARSVTATFSSGSAGSYTLSITELGTGTGTVVSSPGGINCGTACSLAYAGGTSVALSATADAGSTFTGWGGACSGAGPCNVNMNQARSVTATFSSGSAGSYTLSITELGTGTGTVVSSPAGINCGTECSLAYAGGTSVTLSATADAGSTFAGWGGACSGTGFCNVNMNQARSVTATFSSGSAGSYTLSITELGTGTGTVVSSPAGINCGTECSLAYAGGTSVTLSATADAGSTFAGWGGACSGTGFCNVNMNQARSVTATFSSGSAGSYTLSITELGTGTGTVVSSPAGINCGTECSLAYAGGTSVTLSATADAGSTFAGWGGACSGTGFCNVSMSQVQSVTATFSSSGYTLSVTELGTGSGTVVSSPSGINCGTACGAVYPSGSNVTLTATANAGNTFARWTGGGCSGTGTCTVSMNQAQSVIATFSSGTVASYTLSVTELGTGSGTVISSPAGINCGFACSMSYPSGTSVTLGATANAGSTFTGWSGGGCSGTFLCTMNMSQAQNVTATFSSGSAGSYTLSIAELGTGTGTVVSSPAGISCGSACSMSYPSGTSVTLSATANVGSTFTGWSGAGCSGTGFCNVSMTQAQNVSATFASSGYTLSVTELGTGSGTVVSSPSGINCGAACSAVYPSGSNVTLTATANAGNTFARWTGGGCSGTGTCTVSMTQAQNVIATFTSGSSASYTLSVTELGTGTGTVVSSPAGINCGTACSVDYPSGTSVTLGATANAGSTFTGWSGGGCSGTFLCTVSMSQAQSVTATFTSGSVGSYTLSVTKSGTGSGTVVSSPAGISCGTACSLAYAGGTSVSLSATADAGSTFTGWGGACSGAGSCNVNMNQARSVTATFSSGSDGSYTLSITELGTGSGTVVSSPAGISCGSACSLAYAGGTSVTLTATANAGSTFTGWGGACSGTGPCTVSLNQAQSVTATFSSSAYTLSVTKSGTGAGTVASSPAGISCGSACSLAYAGGTSVTLTATANAGSTFTGWGGACSGTGPCTVSLNQAQSVTATFTSGYALSITESGTGTGTVISLPAGINCGTACSMIYPSGTSVTLGATANAGSTFTGWSGGGCSGTFLCTVSLNQSQSVTATFSTPGYTLLSVTKSGAGSGTVVSSQAGINCGAVCSAGYPGGTSVTLTATATTGSTFAGWSGDCSGMDTCTVSLSQAHSITATFTSVSVSSASLYDGIYQWDTGYYLSVHQIGGGAVKATIYWVYTSNTEQVGTRTVSEADTFDLLQGQIVGSHATISGPRFYKACTLSYDLTFNSDSSLTVRLNSVTNSPGVNTADVDCVAQYNPVGFVWTIPRVF